ncbi:hypothetical protein J1N35_009715 [Gossypium stocksii]|uniref:Small ribosomal subunit protein mS41 SAM domain-containing protein n=2 Tax=Gossypium TaxID=3633 RepID=A0A9D3VZS6_9ROSI|nr:hypothetical protein J1N35_009715 [Gossypium stocksii]
MALMQFLNHTRTIPISNPYGFSRFFSKSSPFIVKVGIPEFLNGVGHGVETHVAKLESEIGDFQKLLVTRTLKLKKIGIPCKHLAKPVWAVCLHAPPYDLTKLLLKDTDSYE